MRAAMRGLVALLCGAALLVDAAPSQAKPPAPPAPKPAFSFGGQQWFVKSSTAKVGPGPNLFAAANAFLDSSGRLHLRIAKDARKRWQSAEVLGATSLGYGTYRWTLASDVSHLDPNVVLGLFTWSDDAVQTHRELDIEVARWGSTTDPTNAQYVVQPYDLAGHLLRYSQPAGFPVLELTWSPGTVSFRSAVGGTTVQSWTYTGGDVPTPGDERAHMNLWLFNGSAPTDGQPVEVVFSAFRWCALGSACA